MTKKQVPIELVTTPSRFVRTDAPEFPVDYRRIVGMRGPAGELACKFEIDTPRTTEEIRVTPQFADKLFGFFDRWLTERDPEAGGSRWSDAANYQCHRYALAMSGREVANAAEAQWVVNDMRFRAKPVPDEQELLPFGTHTTILGMDRRRLLHSSVAIGVGPDGQINSANPTDHIQVFDFGGNLGIAPLSATLDYYRSQDCQPEVVVPQPALLGRLAARAMALVR